MFSKFAKSLSLVCLCVGIVFGEEAVKELTGKNFQTTVGADGAYTLVMFYAPWCGHCQETKPHFLKVGAELTKEKNKKFAMVNCDEAINNVLCQKEAIEGFPTIKLYHGGKLVEEYMDENNEESFRKYIQNPPKPGEGRPSTEGQDRTPDVPLKDVLMLDAKNFTKLKDIEKALVFFYAPWCPHCTETKPKFSSAAAKVVKESGGKYAFAALNCDKTENECEFE